MEPIIFNGYKCVLAPGQYGNSQKAIQLIDVLTEEPVAVATVCLIHETTKPDEVFIKDYSENEGMAKTLINAGIIEPTVLDTVRSGFVSINKYKLTEKALNQLFP